MEALLKATEGKGINGERPDHHGRMAPYGAGG
jgi:hypothetical protein